MKYIFRVIVSLKPSDCGKNYDPHSQVEKYMKHQKLNTGLFKTIA